MLSKILDNRSDRLMKFPKATEHVIEVAIIDIIYVFKVYFKLINWHILWSILHYLENLEHIVLTFLFFSKVCMIMCIVEEDQLEIFITCIHF